MSVVVTEAMAMIYGLEWWITVTGLRAFALLEAERRRVGHGTAGGSPGVRAEGGGS